MLDDVYDKDIRYPKIWTFEDSIFIDFKDADFKTIVDQDFELSKIKLFIKDLTQ